MADFYKILTFETSLKQKKRMKTMVSILFVVVFNYSEINSKP